MLFRPLTELFLLAACLAAPADWARVTPELELSFPADHGAHPDTRIEWWYITGQLESKAGRRFGFQFTVFRVGLSPATPEPDASPLRASQMFAGHLALTDIERSQTLFAERLRRTGSPLAHAALRDLDVTLEDWSLVRGADDRLHLIASDATSGFALDLSLEPRKPLVLHGDRGYSSKGADPGNASAYSSWTRLATEGRLAVDGESLEVRGESWYDHEFGTSVLEEGVVGWDWFGLHLDDGRDLMLFVLRREDGSLAPASAGTLVEADGSSQRLEAADFSIESDAEWESPRTRATYPAAWRIRIDGAGLDLRLAPQVADCELCTQRSTGVCYWEGPVAIDGSTGGRGYAELTGYAGSMEGRF